MSPSFFVWLIDALWLILVVYLTVSAIGVKRDTQPHLGQSLGLTLVLITAFLLPHLRVFRFLNFAPVSPVLSMIGVVLCLAGMGLLVWARRHLGKNWSQTVSRKEGHELVTSGPYRYVRHPMYTGGILACLGSAITAGGAWVFLLVFLTPLFLWRVGAEDKLMEQQFPNEYLNNVAGAYITRENALTHGVASTKVYAQMQIPSGTTLSWLASNDGGVTWEPMTIEGTRPVDEEWTEYTMTRNFTNPTGTRVRYKAVMTGTTLTFPRIHSLEATLS